MTSNEPLTMVSMSGGLEFFIDGEGFDDQPHISSVMFEPTQTDPNLFAGPPLNSKYPEPPCFAPPTDPLTKSHLLQLS